MSRTAAKLLMMMPEGAQREAFYGDWLERNSTNCPDIFRP